MKLSAGWFVMAIVGASTSALADDAEPKAITVSTEWMHAMVSPGGAVAVPTKEKPLDYIVDLSLKACKKLKAGTAKDIKGEMALKSCIEVAYKALSDGQVDAQWSVEALSSVVASMPAKYAKKITAQGKDSTIVEGHFLGEGVNLDVYFALDANNHVHAVWMTSEATG